MSQNIPLVSIYIPTHNRRILLQRAIDSVFAQTYPNLELFVINDGSSDDTKVFLDDLSHPKIKLHILHQAKSLGACVARNLAINKAEGFFITGLDDDDEFLPNRITNLVNHYNNKYSFICTGFFWDYGKQRRKVNAEEMTISLNAQLNYNFASNQVLVETSKIKKINGFDESLVACQDYDMWTRLIEHFGPAKRISGASYVIHRGDDAPRITESKNWLKGHDQFMLKHRNKMSKNNLTNQRFRRLIASRSKMTLKELGEQLKSGLITQKLRYFLSSNLTFIASIRRRLIENKTK